MQVWCVFMLHTAAAQADEPRQDKKRQKLFSSRLILTMTLVVLSYLRRFAARAPRGAGDGDGMVNRTRHEVRRGKLFATRGRASLRATLSAFRRTARLPSRREIRLCARDGPPRGDHCLQRGFEEVAVAQERGKARIGKD